MLEISSVAGYLVARVLVASYNMCHVIIDHESLPSDCRRQQQLDASLLGYGLSASLLQMDKISVKILPSGAEDVRGLRHPTRSSTASESTQSKMHVVAGSVR